MKTIRKTQKQEDTWVDVHDDKLMVELKFRKPLVEQRDMSVWSKTDTEKNLLKKFRRSYKGNKHFNSIPKKISQFKSKLIIQLKRNKVFSNSTYSQECYWHDIPSILNKYYAENKKTKKSENLVIKYVFNNITYKPNERPAYPGF